MSYYIVSLSLLLFSSITLIIIIVILIAYEIGGECSINLLIRAWFAKSKFTRISRSSCVPHFWLRFF